MLSNRLPAVLIGALLTITFMVSAAPRSGAQVAIFGAIKDKWVALGSDNGRLGRPTRREVPTFDGVGRYQTFNNGVIYWHPQTGAHAVWGAIGAKWAQIGRERFGYPITDESTTPDGVGRFNHFKALHLPGAPELSIYWHPSTGAQEIFGDIRKKWASLGWERSPLGYPKAPESAAFDNVGRSQAFAGGYISWHPRLGAHGVWGLIGTRWAQIGRERFGYPVTDESRTADGAGRFNHFKAQHLAGTPSSSIFWHPSSGAHEVFGAIRDKWAAMGWERSTLGYPTGPEAVVFDNVGRSQPFAAGYVSWHPQLGAHAVWGAIGAKWAQVGRERFGYPVTDETKTADGVGRFNHFKAMHIARRPSGSIFWHPNTGAREVFGAIRDKWAELGWERGALGYPTSSETPVFDNVGRTQMFAAGTISWHPQLGAHGVWGLIGAKWAELGREHFGYPLTDETKTPDGAGRYNHFRAMHAPGKPEGSIYWSSASGAHEVFGAIRDKWAALGWERGALGYPTGKETPTSDSAGRTQSFGGGTVAWHPQTGTHAVWGLIGKRWNELGRERFGFPITDETKTPDGAGRYNHFKAVHVTGAPENSIYWAGGAPAAHEIYGPIRQRWAELGWERSTLGYPTGPEHDREGGGRIQDFQSGVIEWTAARGAYLQWVRMRRTITTPSGTALGGWAELEIHADGNYRFRGHMHGSGFDSYKFRVRVALSTKTGLALVAQKTGDVEGTVNIDPRRDFDWNDAGRSELLQREWMDIEHGTFHVAKSYENTGVLGSVGAIATDILNFVLIDVALGPHTAMIMFLGNELTNITNASAFGVGAAPGLVIVGGSSWIMGPTFAVPVFIGTVAATNALVKSRHPSSEEYAIARLVFGDTLPAIDRIIFTNLSGADERPFVMPNADGSIVMNIGEKLYNQAGGPQRAVRGSKYPVPGETFIHELVHAWQLTRNRSIGEYICKGISSSDYTPLPDGSPWADNNIEQQATIVNLWFRNHAGGPAPTVAIGAWTDFEDLRRRLESPAAMRDPKFSYIMNNIRAAQN